MIHISQVLPLVEKRLKDIQPKEAVHFRTYKRDRGFLIYCVDDSEFQIIETGFYNQSFTGNSSSTRKQAKKALKREFPRSNKVWVEYYEGVDDPNNINSSHTPQMQLF